ncbi:MAG: hypothetical protein ABI995_15155, partial [Acidobacteriota bacterium]
MKHLRWVPFYASVLLAAAMLLQAAKTDGWSILTGSNAWQYAEKSTPGTARRITPKDLPAPGSGTPNQKKGVRPPGAMPKAP